MKPGGSNQKGAAFEREVCKKLSKWITDGNRDDIFWRSAMSGGRATISLKQGRQAIAQSGDICAIDSLGEKFLKSFYVECKHRKDLNLPHLFTKKQGQITQAIFKAQDEAFEYNKHLFLVARQNFQSDLLFISEDGIPLINFGDPPEFLAVATVHWFDIPVVVFDFNEFLANVSLNK